MENEQKNNGRVIAGLIIIAAGVLILLDNLNMLPYGYAEIIFSLPSLLIAIGLLNILYSRSKTAGIVLLVIGAGLMVPKIFTDIYIGWDIIVPVLIILFGSHLMFRKKRTKNYPKNFFTSEKSVDNDSLDDVTIFGGGAKTVYTNNFRGGQVTAIFGGSEIDLTNCKMAEDKQTIDIVAIFGGVEFIVPSNWNVKVDVTPIFGGFSNKLYTDPKEIVPGQNVLMIKGVVVFGGGEVKYRKV